jgi:hypothetical protein
MTNTRKSAATDIFTTRPLPAGKLTLKELGTYRYPNLTTFAEALSITSDALYSFGGIIPNAEAAKKLGHKVTDPTNISGNVYRRIDDLCLYGMLMKEKGGLRVTASGRECLNIDPIKADAARARALREIPLIAQCFDRWNGSMPDATAMPPKLAEITGTDWKECRAHVSALQKLFSSVFPILRSSSQVAETSNEITAGEKSLTLQTPSKSESVSGKLLGEVRTTVGSVVIKDEMTLEVGRRLLDIIQSQLDLDKKPMKLKSEGKQAKSGQAE